MNVSGKGKGLLDTLASLERTMNETRVLGELEKKMEVSEDFDDVLDDFQDYIPHSALWRCKFIS
ncbi:MAG: hypothetical protein HYW48_09085 [Deltaproteobacteria bacterium]|nr:hypothetical protein [Deltaproteobacteria bacterium]